MKKFEGNPQHPGSRGRNCAKGPATLNQVTDPDRILYPLKRAGARGEGRWGDAKMADYYAQQAGGSDPFNWIKIHPLMTRETIGQYPFDHAGEGETSLMLHLLPQSVDLGRLGEAPHRGVGGRDPKKFATAADGKRLAETIIAELHGKVEAFAGETIRTFGSAASIETPERSRSVS